MDTGQWKTFAALLLSSPTIRTWVELTDQTSLFSITPPNAKLLAGIAPCSCTLWTLQQRIPTSCTVRSATHNRHSTWHTRTSWLNWCPSCVEWTRQEFPSTGALAMFLLPLLWLLMQKRKPQRDVGPANTATRWTKKETSHLEVQVLWRVPSVSLWTEIVLRSGTDFKKCLWPHLVLL